MSALLDRQRKLNPYPRSNGRSPIVKAYAQRFAVSTKRLSYTNIEQLGACKNDEARRILLGVSK
jgi:hypothetical protein